MNIIKNNIDKVYNKELITDIMKKNMKKEIDKDLDDDDDSDETSGRQYKIPPKTFGGKAVDSLTNWVGNWNYIIFLTAFLLVWMIINTSLILSEKSWDPYPFILLNLVIAAIAAIEVPIILMSQNRQEQRDRAREEYDYAIDRKSGKEILEIRSQLNRIEKRLEK